MSKLQTVFCLHCLRGLEFTEGAFNAARDEMIAHESQCEANPLVVRIKELEAELEALKGAPSS